MTLNDIIVSALAQLDRGHDAQTLDTWREKLTRFANEAVLDLSAAYCPRRTEELTLDGKLLRTERLSRPCIRVHGVKRLGRYMTFHETGDSGVLCVPGGKGRQHRSGKLPLCAAYAFQHNRRAGAAGLDARAHRVLCGGARARKRRGGRAARRQHLFPDV